MRDRPYDRKGIQIYAYAYLFPVKQDYKKKKQIAEDVQWHWQQYILYNTKPLLMLETIL